MAVTCYKRFDSGNGIGRHGEGLTKPGTRHVSMTGFCRGIWQTCQLPVVLVDTFSSDGRATSNSFLVQRRHSHSLR